MGSQDCHHHPVFTWPLLPLCPRRPRGEQDLLPHSTVMSTPQSGVSEGQVGGLVSSPPGSTEGLAPYGQTLQKQSAHVCLACRGPARLPSPGERPLKTVTLISSSAPWRRVSTFFKLNEPVASLKTQEFFVLSFPRKDRGAISLKGNHEGRRHPYQPSLQGRSGA